MHIEYAIRGSVTAFEVTELLKQTGWAGTRNVDDVDTMLKNTPLHITARHDGNLVGFARSLTDFVYRAFIDDVIVDQAYRGQGIGAQLIARISSQLDEVESVVLACDEAVVPFYRKQGFSLIHNPHMKRD